MENNDYIYDLQDYMPLIIKTVSEVTGRYVELENSIELGVAMEKFITVQHHYDPMKGPFIPYVKKSIRNAVIDYLKSEQRHSYYSVEDYEILQADSSDVCKAAQLAMYEKELHKYKITFSKLALKAPVHQLTRERLVKLAKQLSTDKTVTSHVKEKKRLPITTISNNYDVSIKVVKSHKLYLLAILIAYMGEVDPVTQWIEEQC